MRYAFVSDIHANLAAWDAVLQDIQAAGVDEIVCLGDVIGYGPEPAAVLESVYADVQHVVLGNHDAAACGRISLKQFNRDSSRILEWTKTQLNEAAFNFLRELPLVVQGDNFICTHADLSAPAEFHYVFQPQEATSCWEACLEQLVFIGHTHIPGVHMIGEMEVPHWLPPQELRCNKAMRYIINVGSVGQPRDGDLRACYCIYHTDKEMVSFRRVLFDVETHVARLREKRLPIHPSMLDGQVSNPGERLRNMEFHPVDTLEGGRPPEAGPRRRDDAGPAPGPARKRAGRKPTKFQPTGTESALKRIRRTRARVKSSDSTTLLVVIGIILLIAFIVVVGGLALRPKPPKVLPKPKRTPVDPRTLIEERRPAKPPGIKRRD